MDDKGYRDASEFVGRATPNFVDWEHLNLNNKVKARIDEKLCIQGGHCRIARGEAVCTVKVDRIGNIFVPRGRGMSYNEIENATPEDLPASCSALFNAMLNKANVVGG
jgi:hypothetical protein